MPVLRMIRAADAPTVEAGKGTPLPLIAATGGMKSDGLDLTGLPWDFRRGRSNGDAYRYPLLWVHDLGGERLPLGVVDVRAVGDGPDLEAEAIFDPDDPFAVAVERKYRSAIGGLDAFSISWDDVDDAGVSARVTKAKATAHQLLETSCVPVGMDPDALAKDGRKRAADLRTLADVIDAALLADDDVTPPATATAGAGDDTTDDDAEAQGRAWPNVATEMVAVFAPDCPDDDRTRRRRYNTLTARYRTLGRTPPEFLSADEVDALGPDEWRGLWLEDELSGSRVGAVLNSRNMELLTGARDALDTVIKSAQATSKDEGRGGAGEGRRAIDPDLAAMLDKITATLDKIAAAVEVDAAEDATEDATPEGDMPPATGAASADAGDERTTETDDDDARALSILAAARTKLKG